VDQLFSFVRLGAAQGKIQLRRKQHLRAVEDGSDSMLIHLGKHRLGQKDQSESDVDSLFDDVLEEPSPEAPRGDGSLPG
jgi:hypothetical protein